MTELSYDEAIHCAKILTDYFDGFSRVDEYMHQNKMSQIETLPIALPGLGIETEFFDDFSIEPNDMNFKIIQPTVKGWSDMLTKVSSIPFQDGAVPGKSLRLSVQETTTGKYVGFIRFGSPVINCKPRNDMLGHTPELSSFNRTAIMGFTIIPAQPFGYNYLGGKLLAAICCTHFIREKLNEKYDMNLVLFETTSLYGTSKSNSQYDGMKPFLRYKGLTESNFVPMIHGKDYTKLLTYVENIIGDVVPRGASSRKLKAITKIIGLIKKSLKGQDLENFILTINNAKSLTEQKRYYASNYGISNYIDIVNGSTDKIIPSENYDKHTLDNVISWWKRKATTRYNTLRESDKLRTEQEVWDPFNKTDSLDIIR
tara:strand:- start:924 stop:2033 length:1110 start_codon:yes stop_codon:yes gene_type:complete